MHEFQRLQLLRGGLAVTRMIEEALPLYHSNKPFGENHYSRHATAIWLESDVVVISIIIEVQ